MGLLGGLAGAADGEEAALAELEGGASWICGDRPRMAEVEEEEELGVLGIRIWMSCPPAVERAIWGGLLDLIGDVASFLMVGTCSRICCFDAC